MCIRDENLKQNMHEMKYSRVLALRGTLEVSKLFGCFYRDKTILAELVAIAEHRWTEIQPGSAGTGLISICL